MIFLVDLDAPEGHVPHEDGGVVLQDVQRGLTGADVDQGDVFTLDVVVGLKDVLKGEGLDVDDAGGKTDQGGQVDVIVHHLFLGSHQKHAHLAGVVLDLPEELEIQVHIADVEGDVLLGLEMDGFLQLFLRHRLDVDFLDDDRVPADGQGHVGCLDVGGLEQLADDLRHRFRVADGAVLDGARRDIGHPEPSQLAPVLGLGDFGDFHRT